MRLRTALAAAALAAILSACSSTGTDKTSSDSAEELPASGSGFVTNSTEIGSTPKVEKPARGANRPYKVLGKSYTPVTGDQPMRQRGIASWYGKQFHGKKTSNGEVFNMYAVSAAHKTMELPSYAKVTNLENGKSIILRVNDRGPFYGGRIIDLSYEAARRLGYAQKGTARVEVERIRMAEIADGSWKSSGVASSSAPVTTETAAASAPEQAIGAESKSGWSVQLGAFSSADNARAWSAHSEAMLSAAGSAQSGSTRIVRSSDGLYRVMLGSYGSRASASAAAREVSSVIGSSAFAAQR